MSKFSNLRSTKKHGVTISHRLVNRVLCWHSPRHLRILYLENGVDAYCSKCFRMKASIYDYSNDQIGTAVAEKITNPALNGTEARLAAFLREHLAEEDKFMIDFYSNEEDNFLHRRLLALAHADQPDYLAEWHPAAFTLPDTRS